jgi:ABC-type antimicrobial peptide transport system permease subunit
VRQFLAEATGPLAIGILVGAVTAGGLTRYTAALLYGVTPFDVVSFGAGVVIVTLVVSVAAPVPARRASQVDPSVALRDS